MAQSRFRWIIVYEHEVTAFDGTWDELHEALWNELHDTPPDMPDKGAPVAIIRMEGVA